MKKKQSKVVQYNRWGYYFLIPFIVVYLLFQFVPLVTTIYNSFFENYRSGLKQIGPNFKTVIYLPNLIMASAFAMLFFTLFSDSGPVNSILMQLGILSKPFTFLSSTTATRSLVGAMNYIMWFGNTTILLMAGMMGIDTALFEAAQVDGASSTQIFFRITLPLLRPILVYVLITSLIGGIQMFDVPQILTNGSGDPARSTMTMIMWLNKHLYSKNFGMGCALSVLLFIITGVLSMIVYKTSSSSEVN